MLSKNASPSPAHGAARASSPIANEIVKLHRGALRLRPLSPRGTAASITLPLPEASAHAAA
jgi:hypothetical protein